MSVSKNGCLKKKKEKEEETKANVFKSFACF